MKKLISAVIAVAVLAVTPVIGKDKPSVPTSLTGRVEKIQVSFCMEKDISYLLIRTEGKEVNSTPLAAANKETKKRLEKATGKRINVRVEGEWEEGTECKYLKAYSAEPTGGSK